MFHRYHFYASHPQNQLERASASHSVKSLSTTKKMTIPDFICYRRNNLIQLLEHRKAKRKWQWQWRFAGFDLLSTNLFVLFSVAPVSVTWFRFLFFLSYTLFGLRIGSFSCDAPFFFFLQSSLPSEAVYEKEKVVSP